MRAVGCGRESLHNSAARMPESRSRLTETELEEIERMARENAGEPYRGPLLALVGEVRRMRSVALGREVASGR